MKTFRIFSTMPIGLIALLALLMLLVLGSCSTDEVVAPGTSQAGAPNVRFTLGGAAKTVTASRAIQQTIEGEENENRVENVLALLYDTHDGFVEAVDARPEGDGEYSIVVEKDGTYLIYFVANADGNLTDALKAIAPGTKADDPEKGLETIVAEQAIGGENNFLMLCQAPECITTQITKTQSVGEVHMVRLASRFDIINGAEGVTVNKVTFKNNVVKSSLMTRNEMPKYDTWFETKVYNDLALVGNKEKTASYEHEIYSYENYSAKDSETLPVITIEYTEDGKTKTHDVVFIDPSATDMTPLAIKRNHLYRITLSKAYKLEFNLEVKDWDEGETFNVTDIPVGLPEIDPAEQEAMNNALLVAKLFTPYNVKTLDLTNKTVTFFDELTNDTDPESFFSYDELNAAKLTYPDENAIITDAEGNKYRMPTQGEIQLLTPAISGFGYSKPLSGSDTFSGVIYPCWGNGTMHSGEYSEKVSLTNVRNSGGSTAFVGFNTETESDKGFVGNSILKKMKYTDIYYYYIDETGYANLCTEAEATYRVKYGPAYAIRFKGTSQYAAYMYEYLPCKDDPMSRYLSIKVKALNPEWDVTINDIAGNSTYWETGYLQYEFPAVGLIKADDVIQNKGTKFGIASSTLGATKDGVPISVRMFMGDVSSCYITSVDSKFKLSLRLVRVLDSDTPAE